MNKEYVHYGCGPTAPEEWVNYDISPTLRLQKNALTRFLFKNQFNIAFPKNVLVGDIVKGLPVKENSCKGIYSSHTLEHLSLVEFRKALKNTYKILEKGGIFRCIVPDLEYYARTYIENIQSNPKASLEFMQSTYLGINIRPKGFKGNITNIYGNSKHFWMWDKYSLTEELSNVGFVNIRPCEFNDSPDKMFSIVEEKSRFLNAVAIECSK